MQENGESTVFSYKYGGFWARYAAYLVDRFIIFLGLLPLRLSFWDISFVAGDFLNKPVLFTYSVKDIVFYICGVLYFVLFTYYTGATPGKKIFNLKVVSTRAERTKPAFMNILYRETVGRFLCGILFLGYIIIAFDSEKRGFHDRLCDTRVIYG